ncbi:potassium transporter Trk [Microbacterium sp. zg.B48]|uniref:potassium transporter Trk n=1 Tax=unclassified Microbacterium TaxID=2609290 RepID=UPI00214B74C8|nr:MULTISPECIES: potassium transporter Trk [unclassified Microbacterium]MCR2762655.1 potassium transporter Trk [Microbacterium sp. zg.B48]MCR2808213.1 potassium transporter Trk [Microbacterium sp. zg.B185]WIM19327.1 potassium transporter Trk [Microbacterium sp. zg-B185]
MAEPAQIPEPDAAASSARNPGGVPHPVAADRIETVRVRRTPKYAVFLIAGAGLGLLVALILTFASNGTADTSPNTGLIYSQGQVFGFLALICITVGVAIGGVTALILDRVLARRSREVTVDRATIHVED